MVKDKIAGVVVLYFPDLIVAENIKSYLDQVEILYVIDNSEVSNDVIVKELQEHDKILYLPHYKNKGIAYSLNEAAAKAIKKGFQYLLTMDQDSVASDSLVKNLLDVFLAEHNVGISAAYPINTFYPQSPSDNKIHPIDKVITSGNLIDLEVYKSVGPFKDSLFIDYVDFEYCFRLRKMNYKVMINNAATINHSVGVLKKWNILGFKFYSSNHSALRLYYRTRNRFYLRRLYGKQEQEFFKVDIISFILEIIKIILVESDKIPKLRMIVRGLIDQKKSKFGKYQGK